MKKNKIFEKNEVDWSTLGDFFSTKIPDRLEILVNQDRVKAFKRFSSFFELVMERARKNCDNLQSQFTREAFEQIIFFLKDKRLIHGMYAHQELKLSDDLRNRIQKYCNSRDIEDISDKKTQEMCEAFR